jgi:hypothetical protein
MQPMPLSLCNCSLSLFDIEQNLAPTLAEIDKEKRKRLAKYRLIVPTFQSLWQRAQTSTLKTIASLALASLPLLAVHPIVVGTSACLNAYRFEDWTNVYSSDDEVGNEASQMYSNMGHAVGYVIEGIALSLLSTKIIFEPSYDRAVFNAIESIYHQAIAKQEGTAEKNFLYHLKARDLAYYNLPFMMPTHVPSAPSTQQQSSSEELACDQV